MRGHPDLPEKKLAFYRRLQSAWINNAELGIWDKEEVYRLDSSTRQAVQLHFRRAFGITEKRGWVVEGMGLYLSGLLCGTRLMWFVQPSRYAGGEPSRWEAQLQKDFDWLVPARQLFASKELPSLKHVLRRDVNSLTEADMLVAFALAAYLLESRPDEVAPLLRKVADSKDGAQAVFDALGMNQVELTERLRRWLSETAGK